MPEFIWMSVAGKLHCFKPHTHISNTSNCSCHQQAAAPSPGVAPGICSWEVNPCGGGQNQQGTVVSTGLHVGNLCHFVFFCKNCVLKKKENEFR